MDGPRLIVQTLSKLNNVTDKYGNEWQYHSRSDHHSKTICYAILIDLLRHCPEMCRHAKEGAIGFGINHTFQDFAQNKRKDLDLVICKPMSEDDEGAQLSQRVEQHGLALTDEQWEFVNGFPLFQNVRVGSTLVAIEAKAAMTAHVRARPRLHDELNSSHNIIHGHDETAVAAGLVMINVSDEFISSDMNKWSLEEHAANVSKHRQPVDTEKVVETVKRLPRRADTSGAGFDAVSIIVVKCRNDGSPVELVKSPPAPGDSDIFHYASMINRICARYRSRFPLE